LLQNITHGLGLGKTIRQAISKGDNIKRILKKYVKVRKEFNCYSTYTTVGIICTW